MNMHMKNLHEMRTVIMSRISTECFRQLVESMPQRSEPDLRAKGGPIQYQYSVPNLL